MRRAAGTMRAMRHRRAITGVQSNMRRTIATAASSLASPSSSSSAAAAAAAPASASARPRIWPSPLYSASAASKDASHTRFGSYVRSPKVVSIVGAPMVLGQPQRGVDQGPTFMRQAGLHARLQADHWQVDDLGDVDFSKCEEEGRAAASKASGGGGVADSPLALNSLSVGHANYLVYKAATARAAEGKFVLTLGGDHSIAIGSIAAIIKAKPDTAIVWVDAHADINTPTTSSSKNIHGMVLAFLMDLDGCRSSTPGFEWMQSEQIPLLPPDRLAYIGLRDLDWGEKQIIRNLGLRAFTMKDVDHLGIAQVTSRAIEHVLHREDRPLHLTFDIDSIDPMFAPSTGTRVSGGLTYREAYYICETMAETGKLASMDLVEVNPSINETGQEATVQMAVGLCASALGNRIL